MRAGALTTWNSTQVSHFVQQGLVPALGLPSHKIRVIAPDLCGGFGTKASGYAEDVLIPIAAIVLGRPVKWIETRREHFQSAAHSREQLHDAELGATRDGAILAFRDRFLLDQGAYNPWGIVQPYNTVGHMLGPYRIPNAAFEVRSVVTSKTPHAPKQRPLAARFVRPIATAKPRPRPTRRSARGSGSRRLRSKTNAHQTERAARSACESAA